MLVQIDVNAVNEMPATTQRNAGIIKYRFLQKHPQKLDQ